MKKFLVSLSGGLILVSGLFACGGDDPEERYEEAVEEMRQARKEQQQALNELQQKQDRMDKLRAELEKAQGEAGKARTELNMRLEKVEKTATAQVLFNELQRKMVNKDNFPNSAIGVTVNDNNVILDGWVSTEKMRVKALKIAREQPGVGRVEDKLVIHSGNNAPPKQIQDTPAAAPAPQNNADPKVMAKQRPQSSLQQKFMPPENADDSQANTANQRESSTGSTSGSSKAMAGEPTPPKSSDKQPPTGSAQNNAASPAQRSSGTSTGSPTLSNKNITNSAATEKPALQNQLTIKPVPENPGFSDSTTNEQTADTTAAPPKSSSAQAAKSSPKPAEKSTTIDQAKQDPVVQRMLAGNTRDAKQPQAATPPVAGEAIRPAPESAEAARTKPYANQSAKVDTSKSESSQATDMTVVPVMCMPYVQAAIGKLAAPKATSSEKINPATQPADEKTDG